jgi:1-acyl-sn-glycerol-3-phosphate acyltransferase
MKSFSKYILKIFGWKVDTAVPQQDKYVLIGAPHTSNWDFPLTLLGLSSMGVRFSWVAKHTLFKWPLGYLFRGIGGIPVDRSAGTTFLKYAIDLYQQRERLILAIAPEGTRSRSRYWKTGFYTIALKAQVPIAMGYIDYPTKQIGIGNVLEPSGNLEQDFKIIQDFYRDKSGKFPGNQGEIRIKAARRSQSTE